MHKDVRDLLKDLKRQGFEVRINRKGYPKIYKDGRYITRLAQTPGDRRSLKNGMAYLKKAGYKEKGART